MGGAGAIIEDMLKAAGCGVAGAVIGGIVAKTLIIGGFYVVGSTAVGVLLTKAGFSNVAAASAAPIAVGVAGGLLVGLVVYGVYTFFFRPDSPLSTPNIQVSKNPNSHVNVNTSSTCNIKVDIRATRRLEKVDIAEAAKKIPKEEVAQTKKVLKEFLEALE